MAKLINTRFAKSAAFARPAAIFSALMLLLSPAPAASLTHVSTRLTRALALIGTLISSLMGTLHRKHASITAGADDRSSLRNSEALANNSTPAMESTSDPATLSSSHRLRADDAEVVLISRNRQNIATVSDCLKSWGRCFIVVDSSVEAVCRLLNQRDHTVNGPKILIVDGSSSGMDPIHLPVLLEAESCLAHLKLLCLYHPTSPDDVQRLLSAGYAGLIESPVRKPQLFSLLESRPCGAFRANNVVDLTHHRQQWNRQGEKKRVLVAEQSKVERTRLETVLRNAGHQVECVENGERALDAMELQRFDMAIINLRLPIMNGTQVIKLHRFTTPHQLWVPFIVISDQNTPATLRLCRELSIQACLFKPAPTEALLNIIAATANTGLAPRNSTPMIRPKETRFLHANLLDRNILQALDRLDHGNAFLPELIEVFERDCAIALDGMQQSLEKHQYERFLTLAGMMLDNAGQLGAFALYEMCLGLGRMDNLEFARDAAQSYHKLTELVSMTISAFHDYLAERNASQSDSS
jgi:CheY-like chemotaxis protein